MCYSTALRASAAHRSRSSFVMNRGYQLAILSVVEKRPVLIGGVVLAEVLRRKATSTYLRNQTDELSDITNGEDSLSEDAQTKKDTEEENVMSSAMISSIGFYKNFLSPILPPACRFLPTCSQYGVQAIERFGPSKGAILTAWRILRCSPLGGKGYDPPRWPPVAYTYSSY
jgi:uncharacterized protein